MKKKAKKPKVHARNIRLFNNGGVEFPECQSHVEFLDMDKSRWETTLFASKITCKVCQKILRSYTAWG